MSATEKLTNRLKKQAGENGSVSNGSVNTAPSASSNSATSRLTERLKNNGKTSTSNPILSLNLGSDVFGKKLWDELGISEGTYNSLTDAFKRRDEIKASGGTNNDWYQELLTENEAAKAKEAETEKAWKQFQRNNAWAFDVDGTYIGSDSYGLTARQAWEDAQESRVNSDYLLKIANSQRYSDFMEDPKQLYAAYEGKKTFDADAAVRKTEENQRNMESLFARSVAAGMGGYGSEQAIVQGLTEDTSWREPQDNWSDNQKQTFYALYNRDKQEAFDYAQSINDYNAAMKAYGKQQKAEEWATQNALTGGLASLYSIGANVTAGGDFIFNTLESQARGTVTQKDFLTASDLGNVMTAAVASTLNKDDNAFNRALSKLSPVVGDFGVGDVYQMGLNALQSWVYANTLGAAGTTAAFFGIGAKSGYEDAMARGASPSKAFVYGVLSGSIEGLTEKFSVENLINLRTPTQVSGVVKNILIQGGIEASEEEVSLIANTILDALMMGDKSTYNQSVEQYILGGMSPEAARQKASNEWLKEAAYTALSSFGSGAMGGAGQTISQSASRYQGDSQALIEKGLAAPEGSAARATAQGFAEYIANKNKKLESSAFASEGKKAAISNLGAQRLTEQIAQEEAKSRLEAEGVNADAKTLDAIAHAVSTNDELSKKEKEILQDEKTGGVAAQMRVDEVLGRTWDYETKKAKDPIIKSKYDVSDDGKTIDTTTGEEVTIEKIASLKNGKMTLKLSNGKEVSSDSVSYGSNGEALIYETVASLDTLPAVANELVKNYDPESGVSPEVYARGMQEAFIYGQYNIPMQEMQVKGTFSNDLTEEQRRIIYKYGQKFSGMAIAKQQAAIKKGKPVARASAVANQTHINDFNPSAFDTNSEKGKIQRASYNAAKMMGEMLGVDIYLFESYVKDGRRVYIDEDGDEVLAPNGYYHNGVIHIDINAGNGGEGTMLFTLSHELTHFIREWSPAKFKVLANFLTKQYGEKGKSVDFLVRQQMLKAKANGRTISYDEAYEEFVADSMETMLNDGKVAEKLAALKQTDESLWQKVKEFISDFFAKVQELYSKLNPNSEEGKIVAEMKGSLEELQRLFAEGLAEASANYQNATQKSTASVDDAKMSIRKKRSDRDNEHVENDTYEKIVEAQQKLVIRENQLREKKREAENNSELLQAMDDLSNLFAEARELLHKKRQGEATQAELERIEEIKRLRSDGTARIIEIKERLGLKAIAEEESEIRSTKETLRIAADAAWAREGAEKENRAIEKAGVPAHEYFRKKALKVFKTTNNFNEAGYLLPDGKLLNFSGGERNHRYRDHREIGEIYEATQGAAALNRFMADGNIRIMAESPGIDLPIGIEPTNEQYNAIRRFVNSNGVKDSRFFVDFSDADGRPSGNYSYNGRVNADRIINDIKYYYENGETRQTSSIEQFRYSSRDSEGNALTQAQQDYFADSKVRDADGNLLVVYHGTRKAEFTVFNRGWNFYTNSREMADSYAPNSEVYTGYLNITNPFIIDAQGERWSRVPINASTKRLLDNYGASTFKEGGKWRSTPADIASAIADGIDEGEFDYDGVIILNVDDTGSYWKVKNSVIANDYITFNSNQFKNADNKNPTSDKDIRYQGRGYWYPKLNADEWTLLNRSLDQGIRSESKYLDEATKWLYAKEKNVEVFAIYGIGDGTEPTPLYATGGKKAAADFATFNEYLRGLKNDYSGDTTYAWLEAVSNAKREYYDSYVANGHRRKALGLDSILSKHSESLRRGNTGGSTENSEGVKQYQHRATMTEVRIDDLIEDSGAGSRKDYAQKWITAINPTDFLNMTLGKANQDRAKFDTMPGDYDTTVNDYDFIEGGLKKSRQTPYLAINVKTGEVVGHEGRHRMRALEKAGVTYAEIVIEFRDEDGRTIKEKNGYGNPLEIIDSLTIRNQVGTGQTAAIKDIIPLNKANRDAVLARYGAARDGDIKYQTRGNANLEKVNAVLEKQNAKLREDVKELKDLLKIQKSVTGGMKLTPSSVEAVSKKLMRDIHSKGEVSELKALLNTFYEELRRNDSISLEESRELAQPVVEWLHSNMVTEETKQDESAYTYEADLIEQDIFAQVLSSYWDVSTLHTVADVKQAQINKLKAKHNERVAELKKSFKADLAALKKEHKAEVERVRTEAREDYLSREREIIRKYQESRMNSVEGRKKTAEKAKIRKKISALNKLLNRGTKERNVKEGMQETVAQALKTADILFTEIYSDNDMVRDGIQTAMTAGEQKYMTEARALLERIAKLPVGSTERNNLEGQLSYRKSKLKDVLIRERARLYDAEVSEALGSLAEAYKKLKDSPIPYIAGAYDSVVADMLDTMKEEIGGKKIRDMTLANLELVNDAYTMVLTAVRNANRAFADGKDISEVGDAVVQEVRKVGGNKKLLNARVKSIKAFGWNNLKPIYAFKTIGSETLQKRFDNIRAGEDTWARDVYEAKAFFREQAAKAGYDKWDLKKTYSFTSTSGLDFSLTLEQMMSLYAFSKREQALDHLRKGGIVFDENTEIEVKGKLGIKQTFNPNEATAYNISAETLTEIAGKLTPQQIAFVDAMQSYLSDTMGAKGNEVSMELYGIKLFKEANYFPLRSATQYQAKAKEVGKGERKLKNSGFTKPTVPQAGNPIVLTPFMDVWSNHVNDMSMYHAFVLPMEDFYKVYNYKTPATEDFAIESVNASIQNAFGSAATGYIDQLLKDLNGGARTDPRETFSKAMMSKFKKASTFASLSVVVQQPSAIGRAFAYIDPKYFAGTRTDPKKHSAVWEEVKKYAPVAMIKEMGYFDMNMGQSTTDLIKAKEYAGFKEKVKGIVTDETYRDEKLSRLPALADELAWGAIWEAVKRETAEKRKDLSVGSEAFLQAAGTRFTEVIVNTQVYDSVLSRSANMRAKGGMMSMLTSFMAEPTTTMNMVLDGIIQGTRGNKSFMKKAIGAAVTSIVMNAALVSVVYAMRDDDENETFLEKYLSSFGVEILDGLNPFAYFPVIRDIWSLLQGYDIERSDMSIVADLIKSVNKTIKVLGDYDEKMTEEEQGKWLESFKNALWGNVDYITALTGIPVKNIRRDIKAVFNFFNTVSADITERDTTALSLKTAVSSAMLGSLPIVNNLAGKSKKELLYEAMVSGDEEYTRRLVSTYSDASSADSAVRSVLRNKDSRIHAAAVARINGDIEEYKRLAKSIVAEGSFDQDTVVRAINAEINAIESGSKTTTTTNKEIGFYSTDDFADVIANGDTYLVAEIKKDIIDTYIANGKTAAEAEESFASNAVSSLKEKYIEGGLNKDKALKALVEYFDRDEAAADTLVKKWDFKAEYGFEYTEREDKYLAGEISEDELKQIIIDMEGKAPEEAETIIEVYDWHGEGLDYATEASVKAYNEHCDALNVPKFVYLEIRRFANNTKNDLNENGKQISYSAMKKIMAYINEYNLTPEQKTAIANSLGWSAKNIKKYKLW